MSLHPSNVSFSGNKLYRGNIQGHTTATKSSGTMQGADLHTGDKVHVVTKDGLVTWDGVLGTITGALWSFTVSNSKNDRAVPPGLAPTATEDVTVTVTSTTDTGSTNTTGVNVEPVP